MGKVLEFLRYRPWEHREKQTPGRAHPGRQRRYAQPTVDGPKNPPPPQPAKPDITTIEVRDEWWVELTFPHRSTQAIEAASQEHAYLIAANRNSIYRDRPHTLEILHREVKVTLLHEERKPWAPTSQQTTGD
jgi:hypothetical protein